MNKMVKYSLIMIIVGGIVSILLAFVNLLTAPVIKNNKLKKVESLLNEINSDDEWIIGNELVNASNNEYIDDVFVCIEEDNNILFVCYLITTKGYSNGNIETLVFINENNTIEKVKIINIEGQTKGVGSLIVDDTNYVKVYEGVKINKYINDNVSNHNSDSIDVISGATISSKAVIQAVIIACNNYNEFKG